MNDDLFAEQLTIHLKRDGITWADTPEQIRRVGAAVALAQQAVEEMTNATGTQPAGNSHSHS